MPDKQLLKRQKRFLPTSALRAGGEEGNTVVGVSPPWDSPYEMWGGEVIEIFKRGAFADFLRSGDDVVAQINHNPNYVLGRTSNGRVKVWEGDDGLNWEIQLPDTSYARDLKVNIAEGNILGASFLFDEIDVDISRRDGALVRTITKAWLYEISPVTWPAYTESSVALRSLNLPAELERDARIALEAIARTAAGLAPTDDQVEAARRISAQLTPLIAQVEEAQEGASTEDTERALAQADELRLMRFALERARLTFQN